MGRHRKYSDVPRADFTMGPVQSVPPEWTRHARQPWRVLFPDLDMPDAGPADPQPKKES
jgi:hypothetical protein